MSNRHKMSMTLSKIAYLSEDAIRASLPTYGFKFVKFIDLNDMQAFICENEEGQVLTFRGSEMNITDWLRNLDIRIEDTFIGPCHKGYFDVLLETYDHLTDCITDKNILVTGHSQGAGLAIIMSKLLDVCEDYDTSCIAFEPPRITTTHHFHPKVYYTINSGDGVPRFPFKSLGYRHTGTLIYFTRKGVAKEGTRYVVRLINFVIDIGDIIDDHDTVNVEIVWLKNWSKIKSILEG